MENKDKIWIGTKDLTGDRELIEKSKKEFFDLPVANDMAQDDSEGLLHSNRRDFLKYLGFGLGAATVAAACETPVRRAIPYVNKPDAIVPGVANFYASSFVNGKDFVPILVKTREGRPIKIEGNKQSPLTRGGTSARAQASVLELYDSTRVKQPGKIKNNTEVEKMDWAKLDEKIKSSLSASSQIRFIAPSNYSPSTIAAFQKFKEKYPNARWVNYDAHSHSAILLANEKDFGKKAIPSYQFDEADVIVNFGADFLGSWISPVEFAHQWSKKRRITDVDAPNTSRMIAFESFMSLTGSNADSRVLIRPSETGLAIAKLHNEVASAMGGAQVSVQGTLSSDKAEKAIQAAAKDLIQASQSGKNSLIVSGSNNTAEQQLINHMNHLLGNYGRSIRWDRVVNTSQSIDADMNECIDELTANRIDAVFIVGHSNPVHTHPRGEELKTALSEVKLSVSTTILPNETFSTCQWAAPEPHFLESWGDAEPKSGHFTFIQPTISPLFNSRQLVSSLLTWADIDRSVTEDENDTYEFMKEVWEKNVFPRQSNFISFRSLWDNALHEGFFEVPANSESVSYSGNAGNLGSKITKPNSEGVEIAFFETVNIGDGQYANNPWLQEMPDPLTRTVWDNCLTVPVEWKGGNSIDGWKDLNNGDIVSISDGNTDKDATVVQQYGMKEGTVAIALGYGRSICGRSGSNVGVNVYPFLVTDEDGNIQQYKKISVSDKKGEDSTFASVQYHHTFGVKDTDPESGETINVDEKALVTLSEGYQGSLTDRTVIRHADAEDLKHAVHDLKHEREHHQHLNEQTLYGGYEDLYSAGHKWELSVDLSACIGCGACQVACISENNVPVVGKNEVRRHHEMTWLRIDRYFYGDFESPNTAYQPMMCQHCDNAPCENVCPVSATNHSSEGLNQMTYNRCIGTRYCANNCPYKVRRFNWLDYTTADLFGLNENKVYDNESDAFYTDNLTRMVLNPDVTVRSRGVIEKCSFCVQRIQEGKLKARTEKRALNDGDITTACASACPTGAIQFGDVNNDESQVSKDKKDPLTYYALEEVNTQSSVAYKMKVVNRNKEISGIDA